MINLASGERARDLLWAGNGNIAGVILPRDAERQPVLAKCVDGGFGQMPPGRPLFVGSWVPSSDNIRILADEEHLRTAAACQIFFR